MLTVVKDFLVGGVIGGVVNMVQWSAINNAEGWTVGLEQCDYQIIPSGGEVTGLLGGEFGIILQRGRVSRMTYVGDNLVFQFDEISNNVGCVSPHSVIQAGQFGFWLSDSGFVMWDGATIKPIGQEKIDRSFASLFKFRLAGDVNRGRYAEQPCRMGDERPHPRLQLGAGLLVDHQPALGDHLFGLLAHLDA
jgi:hypothetical protein